MREVAALAGVSAKSVSRVLRHDRYVSDDVRLRVERAVAELHYVPNVLARTFRSGSDNAIGVAVPDISDPFFAALTQAVETVARARGTAVIVTSLGGDEAGERAGLEALLGRRLAGLIATPISRDQSYLEPWLSRTAVVFVDRPPRGVKADSVIEDDLAGAREATAHLLAHGHRRVAFVGDDRRIATTARRVKGEPGAPTQGRLAGRRTAAAPDRGRPGSGEGRSRRRDPALRTARPARAPPQTADRPSRDARPEGLLLHPCSPRGRYPSRLRHRPSRLCGT